MFKLKVKLINYLRTEFSPVQIFFNGGAPDSSTSSCGLGVLRLTITDARRSSLISVGGSSALSCPGWTSSAIIHQSFHWSKLELKYLLCCFLLYFIVSKVIRQSRAAQFIKIVYSDINLHDFHIAHCTRKLLFFKMCCSWRKIPE